MRSRSWRAVTLVIYVGCLVGAVTGNNWGLAFVAIIGLALWVWQLFDPAVPHRVP